MPCSTHFSTHFPIVLQIVHPNRARKSCSCTNVVKASLGAIYCYWRIEQAAGSQCSQALGAEPRPSRTRLGLRECSDKQRYYCSKTLGNRVMSGRVSSPLNASLDFLLLI